MALQVYLISKAHGAGNKYVNGVSRVLVNNDDGDADAVKIANAEAAVVAAGMPIPSGYFDSVELIGPPTAGIMTTEGDIVIFGPSTLEDTRVIA